MFIPAVMLCFVMLFYLYYNLQVQRVYFSLFAMYVSQHNYC